MFCLILTVRMAHKCLLLEYTLIEQNEIEDTLEHKNRKEKVLETIQEENEHVNVPEELETDKVDKVYTIGCFDLFHHGHIRLLENMRKRGKQVIVGVHDSRSISKLKNRVPIDSTEKRMLNVKKHADIVYCIAGTDPSQFIKCIVYLKPGETALYIRGDDMPNFPAKEIVQSLMPVAFLPYTQGVSSTQIRKEKYSHVRADDCDYLDKNE
jgi:cytidyltransferase-like protein